MFFSQLQGVAIVVLLMTRINAEITTSVDCNSDANACSVDGNSECDTTSGRCICKSGFAVIDTKCVAIITSVDCSYDNNACTVDGNSICDAHTGKCVCNIGYAVFFKTKCEDIDECTANTDNCDSTNGGCTNSAGSFTCSCNTGYNLEADGFTCTAIITSVACNDDSDCSVDDNSQCDTTNGKCVCKLGFAITGTKCEQITTSMDCSSDVNACSVDGNSECDTTRGKCICNSGFAVIDTKCRDIDECTTNADNCDDTNGGCTNTEGSFTCSCYTGHNLEADGYTCTAIITSVDCSYDNNACTVDGNSICDAHTGKCVCNIGYAVFFKTKCEDIDECTANTDNCDDTNGGCTNTAGSFTCSCNAGYNLEADGFTCTDIDECAANTDNCDNTNGGCTNTAGSFTCSCNAGFNLEADGFTCTDIDECSTYTNICGRSDVQCTNTDGSYTCSCNTGYILYNNSCTVAPGTPRAFTIDYIQHNKARLSWLPGNNGGLTQTFVIQLGTGESSWEDTEVQDGVKHNDQTISKILTGLRDSTTYFVRMYAYNDVGNSPLSEILIFTTSPIKVETETKTTTTLIVGIVLSVVIVVVISYAIYVTIQLKRTRDSVQKDGRVQKKDGQVNIHIEDNTDIPDRGGYENPYTDLRTEMRDSRSPYEAISTM
ncbi:fibrillin-1-like [Ruditapes philippinarum]|uniref:fibrillin-1-like n=1 Tax=Ruditapes philippinarum TaxID=129788 RepID=UPI00295BC419|nr:fibrillin-1-like [Ruditapes philippinarum]